MVRARQQSAGRPAPPTAAGSGPHLGELFPAAPPDLTDRRGQNDSRTGWRSLTSSARSASGTRPTALPGHLPKPSTTSSPTSSCTRTRSTRPPTNRSSPALRRIRIPQPVVQAREAAHAADRLERTTRRTKAVASLDPRSLHPVASSSVGGDSTSDACSRTSSQKVCAMSPLATTRR